LMKKAGYYKISIGVESLDQMVTDNILSNGQKSDHAKLLDFLHNCYELEISVATTVTIGAHGASMESDYRTVRVLEDLYDKRLIQEIQPSINLPVPGTPFYRLCEENGWFDTTKTSGIFPNMLLASYPSYTSAQIETVYNYLQSFMQMTFALNFSRGIMYSNYDSEGWCKPVYDLNHRKPGTGVIDKVKKA